MKKILVTGALVFVLVFFGSLASHAQTARLSDLDALRYIASHSDLIDAFGADPNKGRSHYEQYGLKEGRKITFDPLRYTASHPDLIEAFGADEIKATTHYIRFGVKEGRATSFSDLDALNYLASYGDLISAFATDVAAGIRHYVALGYREGRRILFDSLAYIASYADLMQAFGTNAIAGAKHYISSGYNEGRRVIFDAAGYLARHVDLQQAFGSDTAAATRHYITWGFQEKRGYAFTVTVITSGEGSASQSRLYVNSGERATIKLLPSKGSYVATASGCGGSLSGDAYTTGPIGGACQVHVGFKVVFGEIGGSVSNFDATRPAFATLVSAKDDSVLRVMLVDANGRFKFTDVDARKDYYVKFEQAGYEVTEARVASASAGLFDKLLSLMSIGGLPASDSGAVPATVGQTVSFDGRLIKGLSDGEFNYRWESNETVSGAEVVSYVPNPARVEILGKLERVATTESAVRLSEEFGIVLVNPDSAVNPDGVFWTEEYSDRLLRVLSVMPFAKKSSEEGIESWPGVTKISLTKKELPEDLAKTTAKYVGGELTIAAAAFENASPSLARVDGKRGIFYSNRLFRVALRIASEDGTDRDVLKKIFKDRYGLTVPTTDEEGMVIRPIYCESSPAFRRDCEPTEWRAFSPNELLFLASIHEEFPEPLRDISSSTLNAPLKVSMRRRNGSRSPLNPSAGAIAHTRVGYDEFMDTVMTNPNRQRTYSIIVHEKAHFMWHNIDDQTRLDWVRLSGWWKNPLKAGETSGADGRCDQWKANPSTWNPPNTTAEDIRFNGRNSRENEVIGHDDQRLDEEALRNGWGFCSGGVNFVSTYAGFNPAEDFGESFGAFMTNPDKLRTVAFDKYEFLRDRIMQGSAYVSRIRSDLTFEVYNLYPDYTYPGKPKALSVNVKGGPTEDKLVTIRLEVFTASCGSSSTDCPDEAVSGYIRLRSREYAPGKYVGFLGDLVRVSRGVFEAKLTIPAYSVGGWYRTMELVLTDRVGNIRKLKQESDNYGFQLYINNVNEDTIVPKYVANSLRLRFLDKTEPYAAPSLPADARQIFFSLRIRENTERLSKCFVNLVYEPEDPARRTLAQIVETRIRTLPAGEADGATHLCEGQYVMWANRPSGVYTISSATFADGMGLGRGGLRGDIAFSFRGKDPLVERAPEVLFESSRSDYSAPVLDINRCETQSVDERCLRVIAEPKNPTAPNGETSVSLFFWAREDQPLKDAAGVGRVIFYLRNPSGMVFDYHAERYGVEGYATNGPNDNGEIVANDGSKFPAYNGEIFSCPPKAPQPCDATTWVQYRARVVLPVGSAAGTWGVSGFYLADRVWNYRNYDFTELFRFDPSAVSGGPARKSPQASAGANPFTFEVKSRTSRPTDTTGNTTSQGNTGVLLPLVGPQTSNLRSIVNDSETRSPAQSVSQSEDVVSGSAYRISRNASSKANQTQQWVLEHRGNTGVIFNNRVLPPTTEVLWRERFENTYLPTSAWTRACGDRVWSVQDGYALLFHVGDKALHAMRPGQLVVDRKAEVSVVTDVRCGFAGSVWIEGYSLGVSGDEPPLRFGEVPATRFGFALDRAGTLTKRQVQTTDVDVLALCTAAAREQRLFCERATMALGR